MKRDKMRPRIREFSNPILIEMMNHVAQNKRFLAAADDLIRYMTSKDKERDGRLRSRQLNIIRRRARRNRKRINDHGSLIILSVFPHPFPVQ